MAVGDTDTYKGKNKITATRPEYQFSDRCRVKAPDAKHGELTAKGM